jgi:hypothetical protein
MVGRFQGTDGKASHMEVKKKKYNNADLSRLNKVISADIYRRIEAMHMTVDDILPFLWPAEALGALRAAHPYAYSSSSTQYDRFHYLGTTFTLAILPSNLGISTPRYGIASPELIEEDSKLQRLLTMLGAMTAKWFDVEFTIRQLFENYRVSQVRFLLPHIQSVIDPAHAFHRVKPVATYVDDPILKQAIRQVVATLSAGLLSDPDRTLPEFNRLGFKVALTKEAGLSTTYATSEVFWVA